MFGGWERKIIYTSVGWVPGEAYSVKAESSVMRQGHPRSGGFWRTAKQTLVEVERPMWLRWGERRGRGCYAIASKEMRGMFLKLGTKKGLVLGSPKVGTVGVYISQDKSHMEFRYWCVVGIWKHCIRL